MNSKITLSVLGFGNMGQAIVGGLINKGIMSPEDISIYDPDEGKQKTAKEMKVDVCPLPEILLEKSRVILVAVKPQVLKEALFPIKQKLHESVLLVSIVAGVPIEFYKKFLGVPNLKIIRSMPNTPALVGCGITGVSLSPECGEEEVRVGKVIFSSVGEVVFVPEPQIDVVTAISGSGPAYFFYLCEGLISAGESLGLDKETAYKLAVQTLYGAGTLAKVSKELPETLRMRVTSKGGTTERAINYFQDKDFLGIVKEAIHSAYRRAKELGMQNLLE
ncbi:MAG: pyrroline-5-carboxylate reductase [Candidatus Hydrogenedentes bacterium]|nr:pyrroline-5-carboxylate reductase [Candidatus Hydrogenedentota bacterium]